MLKKKKKDIFKNKDGSANRKYLGFIGHIVSVIYASLIFLQAFKNVKKKSILSLQGIQEQI